jgi:chemotaxis protein MotB
MREILADQDGVKIVGDRFVFSSEVLFDPGKADLQSNGKTEIQKIALILEAVKDEIPDNIDWVIRVDGHTDNVRLSGQGEFKDNWELSQARALSVVRYMVEGLGFAPNRLAANGFGEFQPVNPDDSVEARAQNRRIEIKLTER